MTRQQYSKKESLNRIVRSWLGIPIPSDIPDSLSGSILSEDGAFSYLAELLKILFQAKLQLFPMQLEHQQRKHKQVQMTLKQLLHSV